MVVKTKSIDQIKDDIVQVVNHVKESSSCHEKYTRILAHVYNQSDLDDFLEVFRNTTRNCLRHPNINNQNSLIIKFLAKFVAHVNIQEESKKNDIEEGEEYACHPFLVSMISAGLEFHGAASEVHRCNACTFISEILVNLGDQNLDENLCNLLQEAMLERLQDTNSVVRLGAVRALVRLQDVENRNCPVVCAYVRSLCDPSETVRREVVKVVAVTSRAVVKEIKDRTRDVHPSVRVVAFSVCAKLGHKIFSMFDRQYILRSGFAEVKENVKKCFYTCLLPTWLSNINKNYVELLKAILINAEDSDVLLSKHLGEKLIQAFFKSEPIVPLLEALKLDENKILMAGEWTFEKIAYWNLVTRFLREHDDYDENLEKILPELTPLCNFIEVLVAKQDEILTGAVDSANFHVCLYYLFNMASEYDLSDEVGRLTLKSLVKDILTNFKSSKVNSWSSLVLSEIVKIDRKLSRDPVTFLNDVCYRISDIREPLVDFEPDPHEISEKNSKITKLKAKIEVTEGSLEEAVANQEFEKASNINEQLNELRKEMETLITPPPSQTEQVRVSRDDPETICWALDLLYESIKHSGIWEAIRPNQQGKSRNNVLPPALISCLDEFLRPLMKNNIQVVRSKALRCIHCFCIFSRDEAAEYVKINALQLVQYQVIPNYNKDDVVLAINAICDFIMVYGVGFFESNPVEDGNSTVSSIGHKKRLYTTEDDGMTMQAISNHLKIDFIVEVFFDMLDSEDDDIRINSLTALTKLILSDSSDLPTTPQMITRIILKYFNPLTEKSSAMMQQLLGNILSEYVSRIKDAKFTIEKAVIPVLTALLNAPKSSPLSEVNIDKVVEFLTGILAPTKDDVVDVHRVLAHTLCKEITTQPYENAVFYCAKMLNRLFIVPSNSPDSKELKKKAELLLEIDDLEKSTRRHIANFIKKLTVDEEDTTVDSTMPTANTRNSNVTNLTAVNTVVNNTVLSTVLEDDHELSTNDIIRNVSGVTNDESTDTDEPRSKRSRRGNGILSSSGGTDVDPKRVNKNSSKVADENTDTPNNMNSKAQSKGLKGLNENTEGNEPIKGRRRGRISKIENFERHTSSESLESRTASDQGMKKSDKINTRNDMSSEPQSQKLEGLKIDDSEESKRGKGRSRGRKLKSNNLDRQTSSESSESQATSDQRIGKSNEIITPNNMNSELQSQTLTGLNEKTDDLEKNKFEKAKRRGRKSRKKVERQTSSESFGSQASLDQEIDKSNRRNTGRKSKSTDLDRQTFSETTSESQASSDQGIRKSNRINTPNNINNKSHSQKLKVLNKNIEDSKRNEHGRGKGRVGKSKSINLDRQTFSESSQSQASSDQLRWKSNRINIHSQKLKEIGALEGNKHGKGKKKGRKSKSANLDRQTSSESSGSQATSDQGRRKSTRKSTQNIIKTGSKSQELKDVNENSEYSGGNNRRESKTRGRKSKYNLGRQEYPESSESQSASDQGDRKSLNVDPTTSTGGRKTRQNMQVVVSKILAIRISENTRNRANGAFSQSLSQSIQMKRKKSLRLSKNTNNDSFDGTTILRTILEPSENQMSLLSDDSPPSSPQKGRHAQRTITTETSSESGSPLRKFKKIRKNK